ncbi:class I SAM-dependent methyltransferase [Nodularia spumigena]|uniref:class I SAM-dependent methyltransferase n=1 Tax=Nodularia spumigena TaxID=70799 RepID=UPI002B21CB1B|nr:class I SAM-dependent methyltransferase [Nodularia spumigena]MEA5557806.1 class I SAM-dependent methyltransferase [Nodularia spumigena CH309]
MKIKQLGNSQLQTFDTEYVNDTRWKIIKNKIDKDFPQGDFTCLDIGGGNGKFADRLLSSYPHCRVTVLDNSELLLTKNHPNERKTTICESVKNLSSLNLKYDLVCLNWLLHHLVSDSYSATRENISQTLTDAALLLSSQGKMSIFENMYDGIIVDQLPSYLIFHLTSAKAIKSIIKKMGANTAGVGVCFLSKNQWYSTLKNTSLEILEYSDDDPWSIPIIRKIFLHLGHIRVGHFWLG